MDRALVTLVALVVLGCASTRPAVVRSASACNADRTPIGEVSDEIGPEPAWGTRLTAVDVERGHLPAGVIERAVLLRPGGTLEAEAVRADVGRLLALEAVQNVRVELDGTRLRYVIEERPRIRSVAVQGEQPRPGHWLPLAKGELYDPARVRRMQLDLEADLVAKGHLDAKVETRQQKTAGGVDVCVVVDEGRRWLVSSIRIQGNHAVSSNEIRALLDTRHGRVNTRGAPLREELLAGDRAKILGHYYDRGFIQAEVGQPRITRDPRTARVDVSIPITEGARYHVGRIRLLGLRPSDERRCTTALGIFGGEILSRSVVARGLENLKACVNADFDVESDVRVETRSVDLRFRRKANP